MTTKKRTTKRNPQDATLRNIRAATKRIAELERLVRYLDGRLMDLERAAEAQGELERPTLRVRKKSC
jgi:hypothetical protein